MPYRIRLRRHWRTTVQRQTRTGTVLTASRFLALQGAPEDFVRRYSGQLTRTAKKLGITPAGHTWSVRNGRARRASAYSPSQIVGLIAAFFGYARTRSVVLSGRWG